MAALYKLPHIFVVENNKWAIGMNHPRATSSTLGDEEPMIYKKGPAFGMPGVLVDGMDVLKVWLVMIWGWELSGDRMDLLASTAVPWICAVPIVVGSPWTVLRCGQSWCAVMPVCVPTDLYQLSPTTNQPY